MVFGNTSMSQEQFLLGTENLCCSVNLELMLCREVPWCSSKVLSYTLKNVFLLNLPWPIMLWCHVPENMKKAAKVFIPICAYHTCYILYLIHSPWLGDIVDFRIGLFYKPASLCSLAWRAGTKNPKLESTLSHPVRDYEFGFSVPWCPFTPAEIN